MWGPTSGSPCMTRETSLERSGSTHRNHRQQPPCPRTVVAGPAPPGAAPPVASSRPLAPPGAAWVGTAAGAGRCRGGAGQGRGGAGAGIQGMGRGGGRCRLHARYMLGRFGAPVGLWCKLRSSIVPVTRTVHATCLPKTDLQSVLQRVHGTGVCTLGIQRRSCSGI